MFSTTNRSMVLSCDCLNKERDTNGYAHGVEDSIMPHPPSFYPFRIQSRNSQSLTCSHVQVLMALSHASPGMNLILMVSGLEYPFSAAFSLANQFWQRERILHVARHIVTRLIKGYPSTAADSTATSSKLPINTEGHPVNTVGHPLATSRLLANTVGYLVTTSKLPTVTAGHQVTTRKIPAMTKEHRVNEVGHQVTASKPPGLAAGRMITTAKDISSTQWHPVVTPRLPVTTAEQLVVTTRHRVDAAGHTVTFRRLQTLPSGLRTQLAWQALHLAIRTLVSTVPIPSSHTPGVLATSPLARAE